MADRPIAEVLERHTPALMALPGVVGTARGEKDGAPCLVVMAAARTPELERRMPDRLEGYAVELRVTGEFRARDGR